MTFSFHPQLLKPLVKIRASQDGCVVGAAYISSKGMFVMGAERSGHWLEIAARTRIRYCVARNAVLLAMVLVLSATPGFGKDPASEASRHPVTCTLSADAKVYHRGDKIKLTLLIENRGIMTVCYNPFLQELITPPGELKVFNAKGEYVGDLLHRSVGRRQSERSKDFVVLPSGGLIGVKKEITALNFSSAYVRPESILPGVYRLQMSFSSLFLGAPYAVTAPDTEHSNAAILRAMRDIRPDVLQSNAIEIELTD